MHLAMTPVVGHGTSATLAALFAAQFVTHAVVLVDAPTEPNARSTTGMDDVSALPLRLAAQALFAAFLDGRTRTCNMWCACAGRKL